MSMKEDVLSYGKKQELAKQVFSLVKKYFYNFGGWSENPVITYFQYDKKVYTFAVRSSNLSSGDPSFEVRDYETLKLNEFRKEVRKLLKSNGFNSVVFDVKQIKRRDYNYNEYKNKKLVAIYFE